MGNRRAHNDFTLGDDERRMIERIGAWVRDHFAVFVLLAGLAIVWFGTQGYLQRGAVVEDSVAVEATVEAATVELDEGSPNEYEPHVTYRYTYQGETYTSSSLHPGTDKQSFTSEHAARSIANYSDGEQITAYVLPSEPTRVYLRKHPVQTGLSFLLTLAVGAVFVLVGGLGTLTYLVDVEEE